MAYGDRTQSISQKRVDIKKHEKFTALEKYVADTGLDVFMKKLLEEVCISQPPNPIKMLHELLSEKVKLNPDGDAPAVKKPLAATKIVPDHGVQSGGYDAVVLCTGVTVLGMWIVWLSLEGASVESREESFT
eukprot:GFYU01031616.1.p1 GENE.GFYU01031616.1~~GFYU01031616.1.p1  ORF type:complete len:132 (-),score=42.58 GFYU01031616.1:198-593(-)